MVLAGEVADGDTVRLGVTDGQLTFERVAPVASAGE